MDWNRGFSASYYAAVVDPSTWKDMEIFEIEDGSISRSESSLMESADLKTLRYQTNKERWIRIWMDVKQVGDAEHVALFTGLACSPGRDIKGNITSNTLECYSVLKPADDVLLPRGWYAPAGADGTRQIAKLLECTPAPVVIEGSGSALQNTIIAEDGETNLTMAWKILEAIDWRFRISGDGVINLVPQASEISASFDAIDHDSIEPELTVSYDWYSVPNVFRAISDDIIAVARDDSEDSPVSTVNRGREIWMEESNCDLNANESITEYAARRLREEQRKALTVSYKRRFDPNVLTGDMIRLHYPKQEIDGRFLVMSQSIDLGFGATTSEEVKQL